MKPLSFDVVTLFPEMFQALKDFGITSRAFHEAFIDLTLWNPRDFTSDAHRTVDDRPIIYCAMCVTCKISWIP